jgi:hypothetical protein
MKISDIEAPKLRAPTGGFQRRTKENGPTLGGAVFHFKLAIITGRSLVLTALA